MNGTGTPAVTQSSEERNWTQPEIIGLSIGLLILLIFRIYNLGSYDVLSADGTSYGQVGKRFFATGDFRTFGTISGPVYPFLVGLLDLALHDIEFSLRLVSVVASTLTVLVVYCLARSFYGLREASIAAIICSTLPFLHSMSGFDITEPTFTFFLLAGTLLFWWGYTNSHRGCAVGAGILLSIAYLARSEGVITFFFLFLFTLIDALNQLRIDGRALVTRVLIPFCLAFLLFFTPYAIFLHHETGVWQLSGKSQLNAQAIREYLGKAGVDQKFKIDAQGNFNNGKDDSVWSIMREEPDLFFASFRKNLREVPAVFIGAFGWFLIPAIVAAFLAYPWTRRDMLSRALIASTCAPVAIYFLFFVQPRGCYPYVSALCVWAGCGVCLTNRFIPSRIKRLAVNGWIIPLLLALPLAVYFVWQDFPREKPPYNNSQDGGRRDDKHIGQRLNKILPSDAVIMTRSGRIGFYSQRSFLMPPQATYSEIMTYVAKNKITYLIATEQLLNMRPQLEPLYSPFINPGARALLPPGVSLFYAGQEPGGSPYLVFRVDP